MKYVYQVYLDKSISKAAQNLFMTQPALSVAIKRVEEKLGAEIFDRSHHPLTLTLAGEVYVENILRHRQLEEELSRQIQDLKDLEKGILRIGGTHYLNTYIIAPILSGFAKLHPGISLELLETEASCLPDLLARCEIDLTLSSAPEYINAFPHEDAFLDHVLLAVPRDIPLSEEALSCAFTGDDILAKRHLQEEKKRISLSHFQEAPFILLSPGNNLHDRAMAMFQEAGFTPRVKMTIAQLVTAYRLADNGMGCTFISDRTVRSASPRLFFFYPNSPEATERNFQVLLAPRQYTPFAQRAFLDYAKSRNWDGLRP